MTTKTMLLSSLFVLFVICRITNTDNVLFNNSGIEQDMNITTPIIPLQVTFANLSMLFGNVLKPNDTRITPKLSWQIGNNSNVLYTIVMADPDAPSRANPTRREVRHWLVVNVNRSLIGGDALTNYNGPAPPVNTGLHRYVLLIYGQLTLINDTTVTGCNRRYWSVAQFAIKHQLIGPIAGNYFQSQNLNQSETKTTTTNTVCDKEVRMEKRSEF